MSRVTRSDLIGGVSLGAGVFFLVLSVAFYFGSLHDRRENIDHGFTEMWVRARINSTAWSDTDFACLAGRYEEGQNNFPGVLFIQEYKLPEVYPLQSRDDDCDGTLYILKRDGAGNFIGVERLDD